MCLNTNSQTVLIMKYSSNKNLVASSICYKIDQIDLRCVKRLLNPFESQSIHNSNRKLHRVFSVYFKPVFEVVVKITNIKNPEVRCISYNQYNVVNMSS